jgi:hypothetical protein
MAFVALADVAARMFGAEIADAASMVVTEMPLAFGRDPATTASAICPTGFDL